MGYKCDNCGTVKENGEFYYQVKIIKGDGRMTFVPTCSEECAYELKRKYMILHQSRLNDVAYQMFQRIKWEDKEE